MSELVEDSLTAEFVARTFLERERNYQSRPFDEFTVARLEQLVLRARADGACIDATNRDTEVWQAVQVVLEEAKFELEAAYTEIGYNDAEQKEFEVLERIGAALALVTRRVTR